MDEPPEPNFDHDAIDDKRKSDLIDKAIEAIRDDFDAVIILASHRTETGGTSMHSRGHGNYYAQNGMMRHILNKRQTITDHEVRHDMDEDE